MDSTMSLALALTSCICHCRLAKARFHSEHRKKQLMHAEDRAAVFVVYLEAESLL